MTFTKTEINRLRNLISVKMSEERFLHTEGVADTALKIGANIIPELLDELECAALLHDIIKELSDTELLKIAADFDIELSDEDISSPAVLHALIAPAVIKRDFPYFATDNVLSAVYKHTTGDGEMSLLDEIVFLSDYIEAGRKYSSCKELREDFFSHFSKTGTRDKNISALHSAALKSIEFTEAFLSMRGKHIHSKTKMAKATLQSLI